MIHTYQQLLEQYKMYKNPKTKIQRLVKNKVLVKLGKGLYEDNPNVNPLYLANILYSPSYISFQTALSIYGLIPERVYNVTCATYNKNKIKNYNTPIAIYTYEDINKEAFPYGTKMVEENGYLYIIATQEKALLDTISKAFPIRSNKDMIEYLFLDLRINEVQFELLNKTKLEELAAFYKSQNVKRFINMLMKGKLSDK